MSAAENLSVVTRYAAAWRAGDLATLVGCYHDDFTLHYGGMSAFAGDHAGKPKALQVLGEVSRRTCRKLVDIVDVMAGEARAVIIARERFSRGDETVEIERTLIYTVVDGLLHACWLLERDQALVDRFLAD